MQHPPAIDRCLVRHLVAVCALALVCGAATGCVQRRLTIRSNPPGALVYIGKDEIGTTPVSTDYIYYGKRKIKLVKDGYETLDVTQSIPAPWYQYFPFDFVTENLVPYEIRDERYLDFQMQPQMMVPNDQLLTRAENLREGSRQEGYTPPPKVEQPSGLSPPTAPIVTPRFGQVPGQETVR